MKKLLTRTLTGLIYVGIILASLLTHPLVLAFTSTFIVAMAIKELRPLLTKTEMPNYWFFLTIFSFLAAVLLVYYLRNQVSLIPLLLILIFTLTGAVFAKIKPVTNYWITTSFTILYIVIPIYLLNLIHEISISEGVPFSLSIFILIWTNDTFAYLTGMAFGRHKLFERISPKKTWEGLFGGILMTLVATYVLYHFYPDFGIVKWLIFGFLTSIAAVFGDFIESLLKRSANVKDSGSLLPGHGGILDRIDSLLLVVPVIYVFLLLIIK